MQTRGYKDEHGEIALAAQYAVAGPFIGQHACVHQRAYRTESSPSYLAQYTEIGPQAFFIDSMGQPVNERFYDCFGVIAPVLNANREGNVYSLWNPGWRNLNWGFYADEEREFDFYIAVTRIEVRGNDTVCQRYFPHKKCVYTVGIDIYNGAANKLSSLVIYSSLSVSDHLFFPYWFYVKFLKNSGFPQEEVVTNPAYASIPLLIVRQPGSPVSKGMEASNCAMQPFRFFYFSQKGQVYDAGPEIDPFHLVPDSYYDYWCK